MSLTISQAVESQIHISAKTARVLVWSLVVVAHLFLFIVVLALLWWYQIPPNSIRSSIEAVSNSNFGERFGVAFGFFGLSAAGMLFAYAKFCHWALSKWLTHYIFKDL